VVDQCVHVQGELVGVQPLDRAQGRAVQQLGLLVQQRAVGHLVRQRVLERVPRVPGGDLLEDELGLLQVMERHGQVGLRQVRQRPEELERHVAADHRRALEQMLLGAREAIDAGGDHALDGGGDMGRRDTGGPVAPRLADQGAAVDEGADAFLEEEWVAVRPLDQ
jgi:hypothetical protein